MPTITLTRPLTVSRFKLLPVFFLPLIPISRTLTFPDGRYEISAGYGVIRWRYLGPHFSKRGEYVETRNPDGSGTYTPVGFEGPWEFGGQWVNDGTIIGPTQAQSKIEAHQLMQDFLDLMSAGKVSDAMTMLVSLDK